MSSTKALRLFLFGDQSRDPYTFIADFCRERSPSITAKALLERAGHALRDEIDRLPQIERDSIPTFRTIYQLSERYHGHAKAHVGIEFALVCLASLVHYIDTVEKTPKLLPQLGDAYVTGIGGGLFAAAAVSCAENVAYLIPIGIQSVLFAFRVGAYVQKMASSVSPSLDKSQSWSFTIHGITEKETEALLEAFNQNKKTTRLARVYISSVSADHITVSGPPEVLEIFKSQIPSLYRIESISTYGLLYAPHLYYEVDLDFILQTHLPSAKSYLANANPNVPLVSTQKTSSIITEDKTLALFKHCASAILTKPIYTTTLHASCLSILSKFRGSECIVVPLGPSHFVHNFVSALEAATKLPVTTRHPSKVSQNRLPGSTIGNHGNQLGRCKLAIVGMAGRFPDSESHEKLWELLAKGLDVHRVVPKDRFDVETHYDPSGKKINASHTPFGCWVEKPGLFDPRFFNMSPREAYQTCPMQRMALTTAYEALEMSGYVPNRTPSTRLDRIGTFYGQTSDDWREINAAQEIDTYFITGGVRAFGPGRINYYFGFSGPSFNIDTACSSSAAAVQVACTTLWSNECDTAVVGGLSCMTNPDIFCGLSRGQFLSKKGPCATFDNGADGYCRADGCASVIIKRLDDAILDKDRVLGVILGTATNHSADAISITHPHGPTQSILSRSILNEAGVDPLDVDYVEMHGTGTQAGDGTEMVSVTNVFAPADRKRPADRPLYLGSVKSNVGHGEAASGVTSLCKVLMMLEKNAIPPHAGIKKELNKTFPKDLAERGVNIAFRLTPFARSDGRPRRVFINNFSAAGGNTGILMEDPPRLPPATEDPRKTHVITITAKSKASMIRNAENLVAWIKENSSTPLCDLAYTTTARRIQHYWRLSVAAKSVQEASDLIEERLKANFVPITSGQQPKVVFTFTGQGSHYAGMGRDLYNHYSIFRDKLDELNHLAVAHGFSTFLPIITNGKADMQGFSPVMVQLALCCFEIALAKLWMSWGIRPSAVIGHSLGEYAALHVAGVLTASDTVYLVGIRARILVEKCKPNTHAMLAVQSGEERLLAGLGSVPAGIDIACINGHRETVLSGPTDRVQQVSQKVSELGVKGTQLNVPFAFHSAQVDAILDDFSQAAASAHFSAPRKDIQVISPLYGQVLQEDQLIDADYLCRHAREPVDFLGGLVSAQKSKTIDETTVWLEIGPHAVCTNMVKTTFGATTVALPSLRRREDTYHTMSGTLCALHTSGLQLDWTEIHRDFASSVRVVNLPTYSFDFKNYWIQYTGDWCLTKNRVAEVGTAKAITNETTKHKLVSTSIHEVLKEEVSADKETMVLETATNLSRSDIRKVVEGHLCNGAALTPSTLYGEMAMALANYAYHALRPDSSQVGLNVANVDVPKTLIFNEKADAHILRSTATCCLSRGLTEIVFWTEDKAKKGAKTVHAACQVLYGDREKWLQEFERTSYLIQSRIDHLLAAEKTGEASKIGRGLAYKLFQALVDYDSRYRGMKEVVLDSATCEATALVQFQTTKEDGEFFVNPYSIDSCCHISGFILNGSDAVDSRESVYISHGWGSLRLPLGIDITKPHRSYIRMQPIQGTKVMSGDAYIFNDEGKLIGMAGEIRFQCIPRRVMNMMLPPRGIAAAAATVGGSGSVSSAAAATKPVSAAPVSAPVAISARTSSNGHKAKTAKTSTPMSSVVQKILDILAEECAVGHDELADTINFNDLGVDSLMGLTVTGRIREEMELDLDSHVFNEYPTIGELKKHLGQYETPGGDDPIASDVALPGSPSSSATTLGSSNSESDGFESESDITTPCESGDEAEKYVETLDQKSGGGSQLQNLLRTTIATEMGVEIDEILAAPNLAALGMDSLMSLSILGTLREHTGNDIDPDLFLDNKSLLDVEKALGIGKSVTPKKEAISPNKAKPSNNDVQRTNPAPLSNSVVQYKSSTPTSGVKMDVRIIRGTSFKRDSRPRRPINTNPCNTTAKTPKPPRPWEVVDEYPHRKAKSTLLQGTVRKAKYNLFLIPDGGGNAASYSKISKISDDWATWGLSSPYVKTPEEFTCGVYGIAAKFIEEVRRRQPKGPYHLAGWSAGGVIAFEMTHQLLRAGERVANLVLIDSPCPVTIDPLPPTLHRWFAEIGLMGDGEGEVSGNGKKVDLSTLPPWLLLHFDAAVRALSVYEAVPVPDDLCPRTTLIWCEDGVCKTPEHPRPDPYPTGHELFLLDNKTDFGPNRWEDYLDEDAMVSVSTPGNHFSMMMHVDLAAKLGEEMRRSLTAWAAKSQA